MPRSRRAFVHPMPDGADVGGGGPGVGGAQLAPPLLTELLRALLVTVGAT
ncbi:unnamed protein product [Prorocentrum cordatum]|uniref:Uncharacterized protein n=1 Tax=Prorocentrum cordatum TaxID=2364126 RepID=A0ABN9QK07_9DINO|nr:unnamed protein product [Polarella glacialis]